DEIDGLRHAQRAAVSDTARRFVGEHRVDAAVSVRDRVRAGADREQTGGQLARGHVRIEGAVIGERAEAQPLDAPLAVGRQLADTVVVARESGGREIVDARLDPFDGEPRYDRGDGRHYVPGINRHLVAEASADVTADHANLALGNPREHRKDRAE